MTIVVTGGGSGGHITPILAVAKALKAQRPDLKIIYIGQKGDALSDIPAKDPNIDAVYTVRAGKFRRYYGEGLKQLLDLPTVAKNIRDLFFIVIGLWQSFWLLHHLQPVIIFTRGGYVSVPVALGGKLNGIPYITHDSDAHPSLANRLIARWASLHAVALPEELYPYPIDKTITVGVPISTDYQRVSPELMIKYRRELGLTQYKQIIFLTGGGNGAQVMNDALVANADHLLKRYPGLVIVHAAGRGLIDAVNAAYDKSVTPENRQRVIAEGFISPMYQYSGAADIVITRAGATTLAEFAVQGKACIIVPSAFLTGGHQLKNAEALARSGAIVSMTDEQLEQELRLSSVISDLLDHPAKLHDLEKNFAKLAQPDAAEKLAQLLLDTSEPRDRQK
jgi:UDP-N-acetylglucosamine--N-acetylmuramyl-(pentapeptide) pyrophosphoryl-undecaprenol N-acetylglucosamine transferase